MEDYTPPAPPNSAPNAKKDNIFEIAEDWVCPTVRQTIADQAILLNRYRKENTCLFTQLTKIKADKLSKMVNASTQFPATNRLVNYSSSEDDSKTNIKVEAKDIISTAAQMSKINGEFIDLTADTSTDTVTTVQNIIDPMWSSTMLPSPIQVDVYDEEGRILTLDSASTDAVAPLGPASIAPQESASSSNEVAFLLPLENGISIDDLLKSQSQ